MVTIEAFLFTPPGRGGMYTTITASRLALTLAHLWAIWFLSRQPVRYRNRAGRLCATNVVDDGVADLYGCVTGARLAVSIVSHLILNRFARRRKHRTQLVSNGYSLMWSMSVLGQLDKKKRTMLFKQSNVSAP